MDKLLLLVGLNVAWLILGTQANEYLDFNVTEIDRIEELEFGFSKYSSNLNPLLVGLTFIRGADSGAGTLSASVTRSSPCLSLFTFMCSLEVVYPFYLFVCSSLYSLKLHSSQLVCFCLLSPSRF